MDQGIDIKLSLLIAYYWEILQFFNPTGSLDWHLVRIRHLISYTRYESLSEENKDNILERVKELRNVANEPYLSMVEKNYKRYQLINLGIL